MSQPASPILRKALGRSEQIFSQASFTPGAQGGRSPNHFQRELEAAPPLSAGSCIRGKQGKQLFLILKKGNETSKFTPMGVCGAEPPSGTRAGLLS